MQIVSKIILCKKVFEGLIVLVSDFFFRRSGKRAKDISCKEDYYLRFTTSSRLKKPIYVSCTSRFIKVSLDGAGRICSKKGLCRVLLEILRLYLTSSILLLKRILRWEVIKYLLLAYLNVKSKIKGALELVARN